MSTKRSQNKVSEKAGIRFVQEVVESNNCIFESISLENDQGNDCYIEFISNNVATSFCVFAQIKSGASYKDDRGYKIPADKDHLEYWNNHLNPIVGIVFDEKLEKGFWVNITEYLKLNPLILNQEHHNIRISPDFEFSTTHFNEFKNHFIDFIRVYKSYENFGKSLEQFAIVNNPALCYEGLKSLFSNHRNKQAAWFHIISNFRNISKASIHRNILGMLSNYADNPDIFWHSGNIQEYPTKEMQEYLSWALTKCFKQDEVRIAISFMNKIVVRGDFSFLVFLVLDFIEDIEELLLKIAYDNSTNDEDRSFIFWLYVHFAQRKSADFTINKIEEYLQLFHDTDDYILVGMKETIKENGFISIG